MSELSDFGILESLDVDCIFKIELLPQKKSVEIIHDYNNDFATSLKLNKREFGNFITELTEIYEKMEFKRKDN